MSETKLPSHANRSSNEFLIVGIGASAGGIQALKEFFEQVPAASGMAYVVILHLSPDHDSKLAEVLQTVAQIPVTQVREKISVEPDHVYVVSPNQHLEMRDGAITVSPNTSVEERRAPVDIFFRTLAESHGAQAVAVVLSGTGANGSMGLKRVKERGGAAFVQNPREAEFSEMPRNSIATDLVDDILPVAEIPAKIIAYKERLGTVAIPVEAAARPEDQQQALRELFTQLRMRTGHDFSNYKRPTLLRRIERRINIHNLPDLPTYTAFCQQHPEETQALLKDLLISVTNFFRDRRAFETLERNILPPLIDAKRAGDVLRIWVVGCATGEEAYSLAMLCAERTIGVIDAPKVQIFATDIDEQAIANAREGLYTINDAADVSPERLRRFFTKEGELYRIRRELREMVLFAVHNVIKAPPFSRLDLVSCRNMLIYLNQTAQERVLETLHFALNPGGFLFLGMSESVDGAGDLYAPVSREYHIFQSRQAAARAYPVPESVPSFRLEKSRAADLLDTEKRAQARLTYGELHQRLLEQYAPPSVVINEEYDIVHLTERAGRYLQVAGGEPSQNLLKLIRPELRLELRTALYQATQRQTNVEARNLKVRINDHTEAVNLHIRPVLQAGDTARGFLLVLFEPSVSAVSDEETVFTSDEPMARQLEEELMRLKAQLRTTSEQHELQAEELKASNEELQAMNEELRSAAEELETSKEELQSINEELTTVNQELKVKVEEATLTSNNLQNLINSTDIGTIFLDRSFRVNLFTPAARQLFNLIPSDFGRPLSDITHRLDYAELLSDAKTVLEKLQTIEREVTSLDGRDFLLRLLPYRTVDDRIQGVVVTFVDITERKRADEAKLYLASIVESSEDSMLTVDLNGTITSWNKASEQLYGYPASEAVGKPLTMLTLPADLAEVLRNAEKIRDSQQVEIYDTIRLNKDEHEINLEVVMSPVKDENGQVIGISTMARDVTERRRAVEALRESEEKYRTLFETIDEGYLISEVIFDENEKPVDILYLEANPAAIRLAGRDFTGRRMREIDPDYEEYWYEIIGRIALTGEAVRAEQYAAPHGRWFDFYAFKVGEPNSRRVASVFQDITERKRREANLVLLAEIAEDCARLDSENAIMQSIGERLAKHLRLDGLTFADIDEGRESVTVKYGWNASDVPVIMGTYRFADYMTEEFSDTMRAGKTWVVGDTQHDERTDAEATAAIGVGAIINIPYHLRGEWQGCLTAMSRAARDWTADEIALIKEVANRTFPCLERARAEQALRESEARFRAIVNQATAGICRADLDGTFLFVNRTFSEMLGYADENDLLGKSFWDLTGGDGEMIEENHRLFEHLRTGGEPFQMEKRLRRKDGSLNWVNVSVSAMLDQTGKPHSTVAVIVDISERKQAEEKLRRSEEFHSIISDISTDWAFSARIEPDGSVVTDAVTDGFTKQLGYTLEEMMAAGGWKILVHPDDLAETAAQMEKLLAGATIRGEIRHIAKDGRIIVSEYQTSPMIDETGRVVRVYGASRDITERKQVEEELRQAREQLEEKVKQRTQELHNANTELQAQMSRRQEIEAERRRLLQRIVRAQEDERRRISREMHDSLGQQLTALRMGLESLPIFNQAEARERLADLQQMLKRLDSEVDFLAWELRPASLDELGLIPALATFVEEWSKQFGIAAEFHTNQTSEERFSYEIETNLYRIAQEALNNISKHAQATQVGVLLERRDGHVLLIIEDNGVGFDPPQVALSTVTDKGLGLIGMRERAMLIGGSVEIESSPGNGATIFVRVPSSTTEK